MTPAHHYTDEELAAYAFDPASVTDRTEIETHLVVCADCRRALAFIQKIDGALRDIIPWEISDDIRSETPPTPETLRTRARTIDKERADARAHLIDLLASPVHFRKAHVEQDPRFQTAGAVAVLYETARELTEKQPQFALLVANAAVVIAARLAAAETLRSMLHLGRACLERGRTLFLIGRYKEAEESLDKAEHAYDASPSSTGWISHPYG